MCQKALKPFVKRIVGGHRVALKGQHHAKLFAEPLQCLVTVGCQRRGNNMVVVDLVEAEAHQEGRIGDLTQLADKQAQL